MTAAAGLRARASSAGVAAAAAAAEPMPARKRPSRSSSRADAYATFEVLPPFQRDNSFIHKYYRTDYTVRRSLRSLFQLHNETGNIWTHLIGEDDDGRPRGLSRSFFAQAAVAVGRGWAGRGGEGRGADRESRRSGGKRLNGNGGK